MKELQLFKQIGETPGKNDKIALLKNNDSESLRKLLYLTYNRFLTYRVKQLDVPKVYNTVQPDITAELEQLLMLLSRHETGSNEAKNLIKNLMGKCTEEGAGWVAKIVTRDLKVGIDESSICKAFPGLVPVWDIQLAHPIYKGGKNPVNRWLKIKYPIIVEEKLDGMRVIAVVKDDKVTLFSREGHEFDGEHLDPIRKEILKLRPGTSYVLDGEIIAFKFNPDCDVAVKNRDSNWPYEQGKSMVKNEATTKEEVKEYLGYFVWDVIETEFFESQGEKGEAVKLTERKLQLCSLFERNETQFKNLILVPNAIAHSEAEVKELFRRVRDKGGQKYSAVNTKKVTYKDGQGNKVVVPAGTTITYTVPKGEGVMGKDMHCPYEFMRSEAVLKVKEFPTADLRITDAYEGNPGTKFEGMLGGISLKSDCGNYSTDCGSGFDESDRYELWMRHKRGELVGAIWQIAYQEITADGSLRFPVSQGERTDKTTTNVG